MLDMNTQRATHTTLRVTCPLCNGTGDVPDRVERSYLRRIEMAALDHIRFETLAEALKKIKRARDLAIVQEICAGLDRVIWKVRGG